MKKAAAQDLLYSRAYGLVAQLVEQRIENPRVGGSIPPQATSIPKPTDLGWLFYLLHSPSGQMETLCECARLTLPVVESRAVAWTL